MRIQILSFLIILIATFSCAVNEQTTDSLYLTERVETRSEPDLNERAETRNRPGDIRQTSMYNPSLSNFHPVYTVYHNSPVSSTLLLKIFPIELLYSGAIEPNKLIGQVNLTYQLFDITNPMQEMILADSGAVSYRFERENADRSYITQVMLKTEERKRYQLKLEALDVIRQEKDVRYLNLDRSSILSEQNFLVTEADNKTPFFKPYVLSNSVFKLKYAGEGYDTMHIRYYSNPEPLPDPLFSLSRDREYLDKPDSVWVLPLNDSMAYQLAYKGVYHVQLDTNQNEGITLFNFGESYPRIQEVSQLINPLTYLTTPEEFKRITADSSPKLAVDNFWLTLAGENERARDLIRVFYNRVFISNFYFTSYKPGWKTDKGMIFIMYGPPESVVINGDKENWIYFKNNYTTAVTFTFNHVWSAYTTDYYVIEPAANFDSYWRTAVDTWKKGRIYVIE